MVERFAYSTTQYPHGPDSTAAHWMVCVGDRQMPTLLKDRELVVRTAGGDRKAFALLYDRYSPRLLALGIQILGERREAEDVLHDAVVEIWQRAGDYDPARGTVRAWLMLRVRSRALDRARSASRRRTVYQAVDENALTTCGEAELQADAGRVRRALDCLSEHQRRVIELGYFGGLSFTEIADRLGIPAGTVKSRVRGAVHRLRS